MEDGGSFFVKTRRSRIAKRGDGRGGRARKQHIKASFDAKKLWTTSEATETATPARGPRRFKAPKPVAERGPPAEQEDREEGKGARLEADSIAAQHGASGLAQSGTSWYRSFEIDGEKE